MTCKNIIFHIYINLCLVAPKVCCNRVSLPNTEVFNIFLARDTLNFKKIGGKLISRNFATRPQKQLHLTDFNQILINFLQKSNKSKDEKIWRHTGWKTLV